MENVRKIRNVTTCELYQDDEQKWRWKIISGTNGLTIGESSEAYQNKSDCFQNLRDVGNDIMTFVAQGLE